MASSSSLSVAAGTPPETRKHFAIRALAGSRPVSRVAEREGVSRKFVYHQKHKAEAALGQAFPPTGEASGALSYLPVTKAWLKQLVVGLILICHSPRRGVIRLLLDLFGTPASLGDTHNLLKAAAGQAALINAAQDLSPIRVGLHGEIFQGNKPVLAGIDADPTYCHVPVEAEHRDGDTWGVHLLDAKAQGLNPGYTIADAGTGLRAGQRAAFGETPWHGGIFHIQQQCEGLANRLARPAQGSATRRQQAEQRMAGAGQEVCGDTLSSALAKARCASPRMSKP